MCVEMVLFIVLIMLIYRYLTGCEQMVTTLEISLKTSQEDLARVSSLLDSATEDFKSYKALARQSLEVSVKPECFILKQHK